MSAVEHLVEPQPLPPQPQSNQLLELLLNQLLDLLLNQLLDLKMLTLKLLLPSSLTNVMPTKVVESLAENSGVASEKIET
jgi:hypothetical protein